MTDSGGLSEETQAAGATYLEEVPFDLYRFLLPVQKIFLIETLKAGSKGTGF